MRRLLYMDRYRSGHTGSDSKSLEAPAVSSAENVRRTGLCAGSDFTISYCSCVFFLHSSGAGITLEVYGELSERSKVRHSKCRVPKRNLGFESLTLRQKPSHIKAFAHMTGLFFSLKVTSAYMIFGKNSGVPAGLPCVRQSQDSSGRKRTNHRDIQRRHRGGAAADRMIAAHRCPNLEGSRFFVRVQVPMQNQRKNLFIVLPQLIAAVGF